MVSRKSEVRELDLRIVIRRVVVRTLYDEPQAAGARSELTGSLLLEARDAARSSPR